MILLFQNTWISLSIYSKKAQIDVIEDDYPLQISDKDLNGAKEFVEKYLEWAKPRLLKYQQISKNEVINKIYEMLGEVKD